MAERRALVTGANRGLGLETARQLAGRGYRVVAAARTQAKADATAEALRGEGLDVESFELDVASEESCARVAELGAIDVVVNNAGIAGEGGSILEASSEAIRLAFETNTLGAFRVTQALAPGMRERGYGRVVNVSSGMGQLSDMYGGHAPYRLSKTALNALTRIFAYELRDTNVLVNSVCPGFVRTDMGGPNARLSVEEGAAGIVWAATLPDGGPTGGFFRYREPIPW